MFCFCSHVSEMQQLASKSMGRFFIQPLINNASEFKHVQFEKAFESVLQSNEIISLMLTAWILKKKKSQFSVSSACLAVLWLALWMFERAPQKAFKHELFSLISHHFPFLSRRLMGVQERSTLPKSLSTQRECKWLGFVGKPNKISSSWLFFFFCMFGASVLIHQKFWSNFPKSYLFFYITAYKCHYSLLIQ